MAMPFFNHTYNSPNLEKIDKKSNLKSSRAFLISIFIYISLFYIFNLSPSTLVRTTKFWFILSNTLILIISADSGAFSCSKNLDIFDENSRNNVRSEPTLPYFHIKYHKTASKHHARVAVDDEQPPEKTIGVVAVDHAKTTQQTLHEKPQLPITVMKNDRDTIETGKTGEKFDEKNSRVKKMEEKIATVSGEENVDGVAQLSEDEEFSRMSDEELNTRVEEFIRRFNRQIRLQAAVNRP